MNGKRGLSRIMSALLAASSMIGGADVSARSKRKRKVAVAANGVSRKLSSGSNLYKYLAIGGGSALGGGLLTVAGMRFFDIGVKERIITEISKIPSLDNDLVPGLVEDIGDFLLVFDNSEITFEVEDAPKKDKNDKESGGVSGTVTLALDFAICDRGKDWMAGKFLAEHKGMKMYLNWCSQQVVLPFGVNYHVGAETDECDEMVGCALSLPIVLDSGKLPKFKVDFIGKDKVLGRFIRGLVRERLLFLYLRDKRGYENVNIDSDRLAKICRSLWKVPEIKRVSQTSFRNFSNLTGFKLGN